ncbi:MAG TPA: 3-methyl-2-oxobutanoate hydroxymethyltransferase [Gemmatimonadaceae bacterium]|jgi:3-methyl-2-oxobutanoate hydroxymethyltransferase|nr:3-methyl-2-oxobutanoate hydroxymethyltransferase [Gemmatimonadaceae bacterium]
MSKHVGTKRRTVPEIRARKDGERIVALTAYTTPMAALLDPHVDLLLVGDSVGMVLHGLPTTVGVTLDMMVMHGQAVMRGSSRALVVVDLPFGTYEESPAVAHRSAATLMRETGCQAVKVETGEGVAETIAFLVGRGIPVLGHVGLRPQAAHVEGGFRARGRTPSERERVLAEARDSAEAGAFALVVEGVASDLADEITRAVDVPTLGIGASVACDGQILVTEDMLGLFEWTPKFVRRYADLRGEITTAVERFAGDVRQSRFPSEKETYAFRSAATS